MQAYMEQPQRDRKAPASMLHFLPAICKKRLGIQLRDELLKQLDLGVWHLCLTFVCSLGGSDVKSLHHMRLCLTREVVMCGSRVSTW